MSGKLFEDKPTTSSLTIVGLVICSLLSAIFPCVLQNSWLSVSIYYITFLAIVWYSTETRNMHKIMAKQYKQSIDKESLLKKKVNLFFQIHESCFPDGRIQGIIYIPMKNFYQSSEEDKILIYELIHEGLIALDATGENISITRATVDGD